MPRSPSVSSRCLDAEPREDGGSASGCSRSTAAPSADSELAPIRLEDRRAAIQEEIPVLRIDDDRNALRSRRAHRRLDHARDEHALVVVLEHERVGVARPRVAPRPAGARRRRRRGRRPPPRRRARPAATRATTRVFVVVGRVDRRRATRRSALDRAEHRAELPPAGVVADRARRDRTARRRAHDVLRDVAPRRRARTVARGRARRARAPRARCARRRRAGRRRASRRRPRRSRRPAAASSRSSRRSRERERWHGRAS